MRRIAFVNEKGGTCKTTLCVNTAAWIAGRRGKRVLVADLDTQGHAGKALGVDVRNLAPTIRDVLVGDEHAVTAVARPTGVPGLDLLPANKELAGFPVEVATRPDRSDRLRARLDEVPAGTWDAVLLDAPPSVSLVTDNVLRAATEVVLPVGLTYLALDGCAEILASLDLLRRETGRAPEITLVVPTLHRKTQLAGEILAKLEERFAGRLARPLGYSVKIDEAQSHGQTIFEYAPRSSGAEALAEIARAIWDRPPAGG
jgi:chromosome partitioning protein